MPARSLPCLMQHPFAVVYTITPLPLPAPRRQVKPIHHPTDQQIYHGRQPVAFHNLRRGQQGIEHGHRTIPVPPAPVTALADTHGSNTGTPALSFLGFPNGGIHDPSAGSAGAGAGVATWRRLLHLYEPSTGNRVSTKCGDCITTTIGFNTMEMLLSSLSHAAPISPFSSVCLCRNFRR